MRKLAILLGLSALAFGVAAYAFLRPPPLERYGTVPAFTMTDQAGKHVTAEELRGKVWVASFFFTSCSGVCPVLTSRVESLGRWLDDTAHIDATRVRLVSFSVDPERDTPDRLAEYARRYHADPARWSFVTGPQAAVEKAAVEGFKIGLSRERPGPGEPPGEGPDGMAILHGSRVILVDARGAIRGYYDSDSDGIARLEADIERLVGSGGS